MTALALVPTRDNPYPNSPPLCVCGHCKGAHLMDMRTKRESGRCSRGAYGEKGEFVAWVCPCLRFRREKEKKSA